jgi:hypothetical protein
MSRTAVKKPDTVRISRCYYSRNTIIVLILGGAMLLPSSAKALIVQAPVAGNAITLPEGRVLCGDPPDGWEIDATRRRLTPPSKGRPSQTDNAMVASSPAACSPSAVEKAVFVLTSNLPAFEGGGATILADSGRLEISGRALAGTRIAWRFGDEAGGDICVSPVKDKDKTKETCVIDLPGEFPVDPRRITLRWAPAGGRIDEDVITYDRAGNALPDEQMRLPVARVVIGHLFAGSRTVDVASGEGQVEFAHPEAVGGVDCGAARCELAEDGMVVRGVAAPLNTITVKVRLLPRIFLIKGDDLDNTPSENLSVLRCPLTMVSGEPLRNVDKLSILVRLDKTCTKDAEQLHWSVGGDTAEVLRVESLSDGLYVLLRVGSVSSERLTVVASRAEYGSVLAVISEKTREASPLRTGLRLLGFGDIDFIPKNREALLSVSPISRLGTLVPLAVPGAYTVIKRKGGYYVRGEFTSGGYTALHFGFRLNSVPEPFAKTNFASLVDPVQRPIREANVPAPLGASSTSKHPIVELLCTIENKKLISISSGTDTHIPFSERDSCRLIIHRNRIPPESGEQRIDIDVSVDSVSGSRPEARLTHRLILRHGSYEDVIWIRGAKEQFDSISIRVTHIIDESQYVTGAIRTEIPSAQWTIVTESADLKFYATATIPASLYRFSHDPHDLGSGPLALNFGVLSRLTWLDSRGNEGLFGLEAGVMGMGLSTENERHLALVGGMGISIPLGNLNQPTQASVNIHAWIAYRIGKREENWTDSNGNTEPVTLSHWAFVFGPSITIGNIGTFL